MDGKEKVLESCPNYFEGMEEDEELIAFYREANFFDLEELGQDDEHLHATAPP